MADTVYDSLTLAVTNDNLLINSLNKQLSGYLNDPQYLTDLSNFNRVNSSQWVDAQGVIYSGGAAAASYASASKDVRAIQAQIASLNSQMDTAKAKLITDTKAVTDYQKNSPTLTTQLQNDATALLAKATNNKLLIYGGIGVVVLIIIAVIIKKIKK